MLRVVYFLALGALCGAAVAIAACAELDDRLTAFFERCDESLAVLEDM